MVEQDILNALDNCHNGYYSSFVQLGHPYSYLIDSRVNVFRNNEEKWAIAVERLGDNPRAGGVVLQIYYFGNCLVNLDQHNNQSVNWSHRLIQESEDEESSREIVMADQNRFRATDDELYRSVPRELNKFIVIDEWYHRDFILLAVPIMSDEHLRYTFEFNNKLTGGSLFTFDEFKKQFRHQMQMQDAYNRAQWENNRPSLYETWQMISRAIVSGNADDYKPTFAPNSHWSNWPESGST